MQKILITGPESSGKTTLASRLALQHGGSWVPEFARTFLSTLGRPYTENDLLTILEGQLQAEQTAALKQPAYLFCDTGPEVIYIWSIVKYGHASPIIEAALDRQYYDQRWLCYPDIEWTPDPFREAPNLQERIVLFERYATLFDTRGWPYKVIRGNRQLADQLL